MGRQFAIGLLFGILPLCSPLLLWPTVIIISVWIGDVQPASGQRHRPLVHTAPSFQVVGALDAPFARQRGVFQAVVRQVGGVGGKLGNVVQPLAAAGAAKAPRLSAGRVVPGRCRLTRPVLNQGTPPLRRSAWAPPRASTLRICRAEASRGAIDHRPPGAGDAVPPGAARPTVMHPLKGGVVVVALLALHLGGAESERDTSDSVEVVAGRVANHRGLAVVSDLGGNFSPGRAQPSRSTPGMCALSGTEAAARRRNLEMCAHFGGPLLRQQSRVLVLRAIAPHRGLLLPEEGNVAGRLRRTNSPARATRRGPSDVQGW